MSKFDQMKLGTKLLLARHLVKLILVALTSLGLIGAEAAGLIDIVADASLGPAVQLTVPGQEATTE